MGWVEIQCISFYGSGIRHSHLIPDFAYDRMKQLMHNCLLIHFIYINEMFFAVMILWFHFLKDQIKK